MAQQEQGSSATIAISYEHTTLAGLRAFKQANLELAKQLRSTGTHSYEALVTFNRPLSLNEFTDLVAKNNLSAKTYTLRMIAPDGQRWTIFGAPEGGVLVPEERLNTQKGFILEHAQGAAFSGVVDVELSLDASQYDTLQNLEGVFLVDVTRTLAKQDTMQSMVGVAERSIYVDAPHPYWFMEDIGLDNFR